jgi:hypothetical protein
MWVAYMPQNSYMSETSSLHWNTYLTFINAIINWTYHKLWREMEYSKIDHKVEWPFVTWQAKATRQCLLQYHFILCVNKKETGLFKTFSLLQTILSEHSRPSYCRCLCTASTPTLYVKTTLVSVISSGPSSHLCYMSFHSTRMAYRNSTHVLSCAGRNLIIADVWYKESH